MTTYPDDAMVAFVKNAVEADDAYATQLTVRFPFRNRFHHCLRVSRIAGTIARAEGEDVELAEIAGLFHDAGKTAGKDHAAVSAEICGDYLKRIGYPKKRAKIVVDTVRHHSGSIPFERGRFPRYLAIQRDADVLDEVGAMGIAWTLLATGEQRPDSYYDPLDRLTEIHVKGQNVVEPESMRTELGRLMMAERRNRERTFIRDLAEELFADELGDTLGTQAGE